MMIRAVGALFVGIGVLLMRLFDGTTMHTVGLSLWCFGVLVLLDALLMRDGLPAQLLWGLGGGLAVYLIVYRDLAERVSSGPVATVVSATTAVLGALLVLRPPRANLAMATLIRDLHTRAAQDPTVRPADPVADVARRQLVVAGHVADLRADNLAAAAELARLLDDYRTRYGTETVETSSRPEALRSAVAGLVRAAEVVRDRHFGGPGYGRLAVIVSALHRMADVVVGNTR